ncbi:MAG: hypothetical protein WD077_02055 [Bacteroidia bacterium]
MKDKILTLALLYSTLTFAATGQTPIDVADNTLKLGAFGEEVFYYGFSEGDQLIFSFQEVNGKELKEIEIIEFPSSSKFMDYKTKKIENKIINIVSTGIYKFRLSNSAMSGRICKVKIQRIPATEATKNFNTGVYWQTVYDTAYTTVQENQLVKKEYKPIPLVPSSEYYVNSGSNATFKGGKSRITFPVTLPKNTKEWYFVFSASREKEDIDKAKSSFNLVGQLTNLIDQSGALTFGIDMLSKPPGSNICDIYLLNFENSRLFEEKKAYTYMTGGTRENIKSGVVKMAGGAGQTYYIGIKNPDGVYGIQVAIEVVAIVLEEEWVTRDVQKINVNERQVPYLKN